MADGWLVSVRHSSRATSASTCIDITARFDRTREGHNTVGFLLYTMLDAVVDTYFDALDSSEDVLEEIESRIFVVDGRNEKPPPAGPAEAAA